MLAAGVTLVGQEHGVELDCAAVDVGVQAADGARFVSVHFQQGVDLKESTWWPGGLLTMEKCTCTGKMIYVESLVSLAMDDCHIFGCDGIGMVCGGGVR